MKKIINQQLQRLLFSTLALFTLLAVSCTKGVRGSDAEEMGINIQGTLTTELGTSEENHLDSLYLYDVQSEVYHYLTPLTALPLESDGLGGYTFNYSDSTLRAQVFYLSTSPGSADLYGEDPNGAYLFLTKGTNKLQLVQREQGLQITYPEEEGQSTGRQYQEYKKQLDQLTNKAKIDSLDLLFFNALQNQELSEADKLKKESEALYAAGQKEAQDWGSSLMQQEPNSLFGIYLYYTYQFSKLDLYHLEDIEEAQARLESFDDEAQASSYARWIKAQLEAKAKSAIGQVAPDLTGTTPEGETKQLSDYRGTYLLLDFWSSTCTWCRKEVPMLKQALQTYQAKGLTILGVSSDTDREAWLQAIKEDHATWEHLILTPEEKDATFRTYTITGIPQILLIAPDGTILAKGLRGEAILTALATHLH